MYCRHCQQPLRLPLIDLGTSPPSNAYLRPEALQAAEKYFPLRVLVCESCWLVQTEDYAGADELFSGDYAYFSSFSSSWLAHAERYVGEMVERFQLDGRSRIVEVAANDGYLLQYAQALGISCLGIEPTTSTAAAARAKGLEIVEAFFGVALARQLADRGLQADLMVANNVLAHVPDINDFVAGFTVLLKPKGVATFEFPHLLQLLAHRQFDTIYHEHYSYLSLTAVQQVFARNGLSLLDVETLPTHGGSVRVYAQRADTAGRPPSDAVAAMLHMESEAGIRTPAIYQRLQQQAEDIKNDFLRFLLDARRDGKKVAAYGAAAKGNTLLNFAGVRADLLPYVVDLNPAKQHKYLPGSRIPVRPEQHLRDDRPDYVVILPWNLRTEIEAQLAYVRDWGARFVMAVPSLTVD